MTQPEAMTAEEKVAFMSAVDRVKTEVAADPANRLDYKNQAILRSADHIAALERRNGNFGDLYRQQEKILESVVKFMNSLRQAYSVARSGVLVGEVVVLGSALRDLQRALGMEPDENEDGGE